MPKAFIIVGPTAIGKTALSIKLALKYNLPIISADSRQIYKELNIGVAKPSIDELSKAQHFEIGSVSIKETQNVSKYCQRVFEIIKSNAFENIIIVGGTGFYINALINGLDDLPKRNEILRAELEKTYADKGIDGLVKIYSQIKNPFTVSDLKKPAKNN